MNVLSLFDGMSCGQVALNRANIRYDNYFASEIDKYTIAVTQHNYPNTIQVGDITKLNRNNLPKIYILFGGSPCQGFSFSGKQLNFNDPRSKLFFEFVRLLRECKPKYFLLENVKMKKEYQDTISRYLEVEPVEINSALVSAQNRKRLYWTNIKNIEQPTDKSILLKDIIENGVVDTTKSYCIDANYFKGGSLKQYLEKRRRQIVYLPSDKIIFQDKKVFNSCNKEFGSKPGIQYGDKCDTLQAAMGMGGGNIPVVNDTNIFRKLTPIECERLQTLPDNYTKFGKFENITKQISNSQRYKMLGNGWTVDIISHIFSYMEL